MTTETEQQIHRRMLDNVDGDHDRSVGSFIYDATKPPAIEFAAQQREVKIVEDKLDVENLRGDELTRFVFQRTGIKRKPATYATTIVTISGTKGSKVMVGDVVGTDTLTFIVQEETTIGESGVIHVPVQCSEPGSIGNVPADTITRFPVSISGMVDVYNADEVTNGYDEEGDNELRKRYYDRLQRPGKAGNAYHYQEWALETLGVGGARVIPRWNGPLTVKVVIIDSNSKPADEELVETVFEHIEEERPFGADVTVVGAEAVAINVKVNILNYVGTDPDLIDVAIRDNLSDYLKNVAFQRHHVSYARIGSVILNTDGVMDYNDLLVNGSTKNVKIENVEVAVLGDVVTVYEDAREKL